MKRIRIVRKGIENRDDAMARADAHVEVEWKHEAQRAVLELCTERETFTTEHVWRKLKAWGVDPPHEPRAMGPVMTQMVTRKVIKPTDQYQKSSLPQQNARPVMIYEVNR